VSGASVWAEGGDNRALLHLAGGALIGGLGGGSVFTAVGGGLGAGLSSKLAGQFESLSKGVASETGSELLGNLAANVAAGGSGALVGGTAGVATASNVELYNQMLHQKKKDLVSQACGAGAQCSDATLNAAIQAQGDLNTVAQGNVADVGLATTAAVVAAGGAALGPEAYLAYKAAQAGYSLTTAALTGGAISGGIYTGGVATGAALSKFQGGSFGDTFSQNFSTAGLATAVVFGAYGNMGAVSMFELAGIPNSIKNWGTVEGAVIRANKFVIGQTAGKAAQAIANSSE
jgi:filamentous hemagglutinin